jgi:hypothetical protein
MKSKTPLDFSSLLKNKTTYQKPNLKGTKFVQDKRLFKRDTYVHKIINEEVSFQSTSLIVHHYFHN